MKVDFASFVRTGFTAEGTHNSAVSDDGVDFAKAPVDGFSWTHSLPGTKYLPLVPAARYYIGDLSADTRKNVIEHAVDACLAVQTYAMSAGASVKANDGYIEVRMRPGWHPNCHSAVREGIEAAIAKDATPQPPSSKLKRLVYSEDRDRAEQATDRRESFVENYFDKRFFGE